MDTKQNKNVKQNQEHTEKTNCNEHKTESSR